MASIAAVALAAAPAQAQAATPVLEFVTPGSAFPIPFAEKGGPMTARMSGLNLVLRCAEAEGTGSITGPRSTVSSYVYKGCATESQFGFENTCESAGVAGEITTGAITAELVFLDQATHQVGLLRNPGEGVYLEFKCGATVVKGQGSFLSPVDPINQKAASFTAPLIATEMASTFLQTPSAYEGPNGETLQAIPTGNWGGGPFATTGMNLKFALAPSVPLEVRAITAAEIEAKQREDEAAAAERKRHEEEAARAAAAKKRAEEEAAAIAAAKQRQAEERARAEQRAQRLSKALKRCRRKAESKHQRVRCERRVKKTYGGKRRH